MARQRRPHRDMPDSGNGKDFKKPPGSRGSKSKSGSSMKWDNKLPLFVAFNVLVVLLSIAYLYYQHYLETIVITPLSAPRVITRTGLRVPERFWGSYRSGLYFGLQTRHPKSLAVGLMWFSQKIVNNGLEIRHWCNQWDRLKKYGWLQHDGENFGIQEIEEEDFLLTTSFVKRLGGIHGGDWTAKITVESKAANGTVPVPVSLLFYAATNGQGNISPQIEEESRLVAIQGETESLGKFRISFHSNPTGGAVLKYNFLNTVAVGGLSQLKETVVQNLALFQSRKHGEIQVYGLMGHRFQQEDVQKQRQPNFAVHQVTLIPPFEMEIVFESNSFHDRPDKLLGSQYQIALDLHRKEFEKKFEETFHLSSKGYSQSDFKTAEALLSNMVGGIGYFYGVSLVQSKYNKEPVKYWEMPLYTGVPSRSFFPRGFLWDEGFHNLLISHWNPEITKDIIGHWLDLMNVEGWIPREQILGLEAKKRVPDEFIVQKNNNANPPAFFLTLESLLRRMHSKQIPEDKQFLQLIFPRLKAWFEWFNVTQYGNLEGSYRWRGRDSHTIRELNPKTLTSGLDDFPRASHPTDDERHVDLLCWMAFSAGVMADIAQLIGQPWDSYAAMQKHLTDPKLLDSLHWSPTSQSYSDWGLHTDSVKLAQPKPPQIQPGQPHPPQPKPEKVRVILAEPTYKFVDNFGYVSLFPFLMQIIRPESPKLEKILSDLNNPKLLWTNYGLRSLAKTSSLYMKYNTEHDIPYWRGPIWINMNFLAVRALHYYSDIPGPYQDQAFALYKKLKNNVVSNILKEYNRTGYVWEQYNDKTGHGQGSHPFTGWSALALLIMGEIF